DEKTSSATAAPSCGSSEERSSSVGVRRSGPLASAIGTEKKAGHSFAGPAHEPGGGGGDPQAHLQSCRGSPPPHRSEPAVRAGCSGRRPDAPFFSFGKLGSQQSTRKCVGHYGALRRYTDRAWEI